MSERPGCDYYHDEEPGAVARVSWTVYGGKPVYKRVCNYHRMVAAGRRGMDVSPLCPSCWHPMKDATGDWQCHGCQQLWPASYVKQELYA